MRKFKPMHAARIRAHLESFLTEDMRGETTAVCHLMQKALPLHIAAPFCSFARNAMYSWPLYSTRQTYPVPAAGSPHMSEKVKNHRAKVAYFETAYKWRGEYGAHRRAYVCHLLSCLEVV